MASKNSFDAGPREEDAGTRDDKLKLPLRPGKPLPSFLEPEDVLLVSYPRSGNTWMRYLLANLIYPTRRWHIGNIGRVVPDLGEPFPENYLAPYPRIFKTHFPRIGGPCRAIYIYRDGRDAAISYHDRRKKLRNEAITFESFLNAMLRGTVQFGSWQAHVKAWMAEASSGRVLPVRYESMCLDLVTEMQRVGAFLGHNWTPNQIIAAAHKSNRKRQRFHYMLFYPKAYWKKGFTGGIQKAPGYWREFLTQDQKELFWQLAGETAAQLGYPCK